MATNLLGRKMTTIGSITEMPKEHPDTRIGLGAGKPDRRSSAPHVAARNFGTKELTRVLIVDDHPIVVSGCRALFADNAEIVITEAADAESGLASFVTDPPDVCLIDIDLPGVSGFELVRRILRLNAAARIVMFGLNDDLIFAARAIEVGAKGYVPKSGDPNDLIVAIRDVRNGGAFLPPSIAQSLAFAGPMLAANRLAQLSQSEIEILRLIGAHKSLSEIALLLDLSYKTVVKTSVIMRQKLGVHSVGELVVLAIDSELA